MYEDEIHHFPAVTSVLSSAGQLAGAGARTEG
jgi:hypothetical protein